MKLLLVSNQPDAVSLLDALAQSGMSAELESNIAVAPARAHSTDLQLVIFDSIDSDDDVFAAVRKIREISPIPVLVVTDAEDWKSRVLAFEAGADDCLSRPFRNEELVARMGAIFRRFAPKAPQPLSVGHLRFCPASRNAWYGEKAIAFTSMECMIVETLMRACGRVVSRDQISLQLYGRLTTAFDRTVDTHVSRIRRKLGQGGKFIVSVRGTGYLLSWPEHTFEATDWNGHELEKSAPTVTGPGLQGCRHTS